MPAAVAARDLLHSVLWLCGGIGNSNEDVNARDVARVLLPSGDTGTNWIFQARYQLCEIAIPALLRRAILLTSRTQWFAEPPVAGRLPADRWPGRGPESARAYCPMRRLVPRLAPNPWRDKFE